MSQPVLELLSEKTRNAINEQIDYCAKQKEDGLTEEDKIHFKMLESGAKIVLNILESDPICKHGTSNFLKSLSREQLQYALEEGAKILKEKTSKGKVEVFGVFGGKDGAKWHLNKDDAENYYLIAAKESLSSKYPEVSFERRLVPVEELSDYLSGDELDTAIKSIS